MTPTRIILLCQTKKCGRIAAFTSRVKGGGRVCKGCADPKALTGGYGDAAGQGEVLTPIEAYIGEGWAA